jgi:hypothetical protein
MANIMKRGSYRKLMGAFAGYHSEEKKHGKRILKTN